MLRDARISNVIEQPIYLVAGSHEIANRQVKRYVVIQVAVMMVAVGHASLGMAQSTDSSPTVDRGGSVHAEEQGIADDLLALCQAIDAGILAMRQEIEFYSRFELRSEWRQSHSLMIEDLDAFGRAGGPEMDAADGELFCLDDAVGIRFNSRSRLTRAGSFYSYSLFERGDGALKYIPRQPFADGGFLDESIYRLTEGRTFSYFGESMPGLYFSPWVGLGLNEGALLSKRIHSNQYLVSIGEEIDELIRRPLTVVRLVRRGPDSHELVYRLDLTGRFPVVYGIEYTTENLIRFSEHVELEGGILFPAVVVTSRGPYRLTGEDQYDVKVWRMLDLRSRPPTRDDFRIEIAAPVKLSALGEVVPAGRFDVWAFLDRPAIGGDSLIQQLEQIESADAEWQTRQGASTSWSMPGMRAMLLLILLLLSIIAVFWLRKEPRTSAP